MTNPYDAAHGQSIKDPNGFWGKIAEDCHWYKKWDKVLDDSRKPFYRWFTGGLNTCYNALGLLQRARFCEGWNMNIKLWNDLIEACLAWKS